MSESDWNKWMQDEVNILQYQATEKLPEFLIKLMRQSEGHEKTKLVRDTMKVVALAYQVASGDYTNGYGTPGNYDLAMAALEAALTTIDCISDGVDPYGLVCAKRTMSVAVETWVSNTCGNSDFRSVATKEDKEDCDFVRGMNREENEALLGSILNGALTGVVGIGLCMIPGNTYTPQCIAFFEDPWACFAP